MRWQRKWQPSRPDHGAQPKRVVRSADRGTSGQGTLDVSCRSSVLCFLFARRWHHGDDHPRVHRATRRARLEEFVQQMGAVMATIDPWATKMLTAITFRYRTIICSNSNARSPVFPTLRKATLGSVGSWQRLIQHAFESCQAMSRIGKHDLDAMRRQGGSKSQVTHHALRRRGVMPSGSPREGRNVNADILCSRSTVRKAKNLDEKRGCKPRHSAR